MELNDFLSKENLSIARAYMFAIQFLLARLLVLNPLDNDLHSFFLRIKDDVDFWIIRTDDLPF